jgi:hypothetical protein
MFPGAGSSRSSAMDEIPALSMRQHTGNAPNETGRAIGALGPCGGYLHRVVTIYYREAADRPCTSPDLFERAVRDIHAVGAHMAVQRESWSRPA